MKQTQLALVSAIRTEDSLDTTLKLLTGELSDVARSGGIFTKEDIINIKLYVKHSLALPITQADVEGHVGYRENDINIAGLKPSDIGLLYQEIRNHAYGWDPIETATKQQSKQLSITGKNIVSTGTDILNGINQMPIIDRINKIVGNVSEEQLAKIEYSTDDHKINGALVEILDAMRNDIIKAKISTTKLKDSIVDFKITLIGGELSNKTMAEGLEPQVKRKNDLMKQNNMKETIAGLEEQIKSKNSRIDQLKKDYDEYVKLSMSGLAAGLLGLAITGGIFGDKAETDRKDKNKLIDEVSKLQEQVKSRKSLQTAIEKLSNSFSDMGIRMVDAEIAINHLEFMWQSILADINESQTQFSNINNAQKLISFTTSFKGTVAKFAMR